MELVETLVLVNLIALIYCIIITTITATKLKNMKTPEEIAKQVLETKIPVIMGPNGPVALDNSIGKNVANPITG